MSRIRQILCTTDHRPFNMPAGNWLYYQEWNRALFMHWRVSKEMLHRLVPASLQLDSFNGEYYVSLVTFTMEKIRPRFLPALSCVSNFDEINLRTYVTNDGQPGVFFLNIEAGKLLSVLLAKAISGLPYEKASIQRASGQYQSRNTANDFLLDVTFETQQLLTNKTALDKWLSERYCLYFNRNEKTYRYEIHHPEWELHAVTLDACNLQYRAGNILLTSEPELAHYSPGVQVLAWKRNRL